MYKLREICILFLYYKYISYEVVYKFKNIFRKKNLQQEIKNEGKFVDFQNTVLDCKEKYIFFLFVWFFMGIYEVS